MDQHNQQSLFANGSQAKRLMPATYKQLNMIHNLFNQRERDQICIDHRIRTLNGLSIKEASEIIQRRLDERG